jgi:hypothetical protein
MSVNNEKPEWFQMTQDDKIPRRSRIGRGVRVLAAVLPLMVLGGAFALAQSQHGPRATASEPLSIASTQAPAAARTPPTTENSTGSLAADGQNVSSASLAKTQKTVIVSVANTPSIGAIPPIKPPTGSGEGSDDDLAGSGAIGSAPSIGATPSIGSAPSIKLPTGSGEGSDD